MIARIQSPPACPVIERKYSSSERRGNERPDLDPRPDERGVHRSGLPGEETDNDPVSFRDRFFNVGEERRNFEGPPGGDGEDIHLPGSPHQGVPATLPWTTSDPVLMIAILVASCSISGRRCEEEKR